MNDEQCNGNCFDDFLNDYDEDNDNYTIQRLKDIIKICEFLIEREENKKSRQILDDLLDSAKKEAEQEKDYQDPKTSRPNKYRIYPYYIPVKPWTYPEEGRRVPWWDKVWF